MLRRACGQGLCQAACRVGGHNAGQAGIARYLSAYLGDAPRRFDVPGLLYRMEYGKEVRRAQVGNGARTKRGEGVDFKPPQDAGSMVGVHLPICFAYLSRATFSKVSAAAAASTFAALRSALGLCRAQAIPLSLCTGAGTLVRDERGDAQGEAFFLSAKTVFETPPFPAAGGDLNIEAAVSVSFQGFSFGFAVRMAVYVNFWGIRGNSFPSESGGNSCAPKLAPFFVAVHTPSRTLLHPLKSEKSA